MKSVFARRLIFCLFFAGLASGLQAATSIQIFPQVFDFGWVPDNAVVRCEFHVKNTGEDMIALTAVQPSCGCTATDFTPEGLAGAEETRINLTFNTRGYTGMKFDKSVKVKAGMPEEEFTVRLAGHVSDSQAVVVPEGDGIVAFPPGSSKATVSIKNTANQPFMIKVVQEPEGWISFKLPKTGIPALGKAELKFEVNGPLDQNRKTSATFEAGDGPDAHRFTIAFLTGENPEPYRKLRTAPKSTPAPAASPQHHP